MASGLADQLRDVLPVEAVLDDAVELSLYGYDGTLYEGKPELVVLPETTEHVVAAARMCHEANVPLVPRGAATSLSGGPVPVRGGVVVAFTRMDRILELDYESQRAVLQPGVINLDLQNILAERGYFYAPDPASQSVCTLGGNVGENAGGPHCLKYGVTASHVLGVEMVLPDGEVVRTGGRSLDWPGYDLTGIIVGSEGTFGLVTEITCRIMPLPETVVTMLAVFDSLRAASQAVSDIIADGIIPATLEMMDNAMIRAVEQGLQAGYPLDAEAVLLIELDGLGAGMDQQVKQVQAACRRNDVGSFEVAQDEEQRALLWKGRKGAFGAVVNIAPSKICTDISVPRTELPEVLAAVMEIGRKWDVPIANVFHAGDGNLHPLVLYDPRDEDQARRVVAVDEEITQLAVARGGVLTGEHGIGCGKRRYMPQMFAPAELRTMWRVKEAFDPKLLCNPDKVLPDPEQIADPESLRLPDGPFSEGGPEVAVRDEQGWFEPIDEEAVQKILALAHRERQPVVLRGSGTKLGSVAEHVAVITTRRLNRIVAYDHENLTITVQCGTTLPEIEEAVAAHGQMVALLPRFAQSATIGGIVAANESGPHRLLYGGPRSLLTRVKVALPNGEMVSFGSSCVKNVAGYAVEKLFVGSRGSLGAILEVTLRTLPRPKAVRTVALAMDDALAAASFVAELFGSALRPAASELLNPPAAQVLGETDSRWVLLLGLEGFASDVEEMTRRLGAMAAAHKLGEWQEPDADYFDLWGQVTDLTASGAGAPMLKASCPPSATVELAGELSSLDSQVALRASPGLGLVHCAVASKLGLQNYQSRAQSLAEESGGTISWLAPTPTGLRTAPRGAALAVSRRLKDAFDPHGILPDVV